jgi:hypothetical protein
MKKTEKKRVENFPNELKVISPKGKIYTISGIGYPLCDLFCDCRGFSFRGTCSHIEKFLEDENNER